MYLFGWDVHAPNHTTLKPPQIFFNTAPKKSISEWGFFLSTYKPPLPPPSEGENFLVVKFTHLNTLPKTGSIGDQGGGGGLITSWWYALILCVVVYVLLYVYVCVCEQVLRTIAKKVICVYSPLISLVTHITSHHITSHHIISYHIDIIISSHCSA